MHKRKDGQRALCSDYQHQRAANRLIYPRKSVAASGARVKWIACMVTGGGFLWLLIIRSSSRASGFPPTPVLDKVFGVLTPQFSIMRTIPLLTIISILTLLTVSSNGIIPSGIYAAGTSDNEDDELSRDFVRFANNLNENRFLLEGQPSTIGGTAIGGEDGSTVQVPALAIGVGVIIAVAAGCETIASEEGMAFGECLSDFVPAVAAVAIEVGVTIGINIESMLQGFEEGRMATGEGGGTQVSTQVAMPSQSFELNGEDAQDELINESMLPENVVFRRHLPDFLGGATFIGSDAFSGKVLDSQGDEIPGSAVRFGVFVKDDGTKLFVPIAFFREGDDLLNFATVEWEYYRQDYSEPEVKEGRFTAEVQRLIAVDRR
jgi:hypothetical protein